MDFFIKGVISYFTKDLEEFLNELKLGPKDRVIVLLGETGAGKSTFINSITNSDKCQESKGSKACTKEIQIVKLFQDGFNYYFVDTPGLNDADGDLDNIEQIKKIKNKGLITIFILVRDYSNKRLTSSYMNMLKTFITIFPSENFFEHIILVETCFFKKIEKDPFIDSIKDNDELIKFIKDKNITIPDEIKAYPMDLKKEGNENEKFFDEILNKIKDMHPLYKKYRAKDFFDIKEITDNKEVKCIQYKYIKYITYTDFDGNVIKKEEIVDEGKYPKYTIKPEQIIVERNKTKEFRNRKWCLFNYIEYFIIYWEIKIYNINGKLYKLRTKREETWEDNDNDGEKHRKNLERELNKNINLKV